MHTLTTFLIGFSVFEAVLLAFTHFRREHYQGQTASQAMGILLLITLVSLQLVHFAGLQQGMDWLHSPYYAVLLFMLAPAFYLFSKPLLLAQGIKPFDLLHLLPVLTAPLLPSQLAVPLAFALGIAYGGWLAYHLYALRKQSSRFRGEIGLLSAVWVLAIVVALAGITLPLLPEKGFFMSYASAIGVALLLVSIALNRSPHLPIEVVEVARETHAVSTLTNVDCDILLAEVEGLMQEQELFRQPDIDLPTIASRIGLSSQQLSELIHTRLGKGFSRYVSEFRVEAAEDLLVEAPDTSLQAVALEVGFTSAAHFQQAFREITGMTPQQFRKINA
ncbi:helix-turn-helix domain-containing protein [Thiothrix lacustris]|uniref:Helix-turn-helix domain-containing protein n=1 Tax=Thiothrix lacustris TaxID=525917 RepID=A0ABY9ML70_9GAMM|nr:helix-turn-helix domain-containing protein [Thiothrix lacustris]WML89327.1 helix-turn-helix domain-containing protein [Thiothrix lacustris]